MTTNDPPKEKETKSEDIKNIQSTTPKPPRKSSFPTSSAQIAPPPPDKPTTPLGDPGVAHIKIPTPTQLATTVGTIVPGELMDEIDSKAVSAEQVSLILDRLSKNKDIQPATATRAVAALFRKGAANAGASSSISVDISCKETGTVIEVQKYDIEMAMNVVVGHRVVRKLAEAMAYDIITGDLIAVKADPLQNRRGDLAAKINRQLLARKEQPLTRAEEICCATYAQWLPNLNELASSTRLKALLEQDFSQRKARRNRPPRRGGKVENKPPKTSQKLPKAGNNVKDKKNRNKKNSSGPQKNQP